MTTYTWTGGAGAWGTPSDWSPEGTPGADDSVTIGGDVTIGAVGKFAVDDVTVLAGGSLTVDGELAVKGSLANLGTLDVADGHFKYNGAINNSGGLIVAGDDDLFAGAIYKGTIEGTLVVGDVLTLEADPTFVGAGGVGPGTIDLTGSSGHFGVPSPQLTLADGEALANVNVNIGSGFPTRLFYTGNGNAIYIADGDTATFAQTTTIAQAGAMAYISGQGSLVNQGQIDASFDQGYFTIHLQSLMNEGALDASNDDLLIIDVAQFLNAGTITVAADGALRFLESLTTAELGAFDFASGANVYFSDLDNAGATLDLSSGASVSGEIDGGTIIGPLNIASAGNLILADDATVTASDGGAGTIEILEDFSALTLLDGQTLANVTVNIGGTGSIYYDDFTQTEMFSGESLAIAADDTATIGSSATIQQAGSYAEFDGDGTLINDGQIHAGFDGGFLSVLTQNFVNAGVIDVTDGETLAIRSATFSNTGTIALDATSHLDLYGPVTAADLGAVDAAPGATMFFEALENAGSTFVVGDDETFAGIDGGVIVGTVTADDSGLTLSGSPTFYGASGSGQGTINVFERGVNRYQLKGDESIMNGVVRLEGDETISNVAINIVPPVITYDYSQYIFVDGDIILDSTTDLNINEFDESVEVLGSNLIVRGSISIAASNGYLECDDSVVLLGAITGAGGASFNSLTLDPGATLDLGSVTVFARFGWFGFEPSFLSVDESLAYAGVLNTYDSDVVIAVDDVLTLSGKASLRGSVYGGGTLVLAGEAIISGFDNFDLPHTVNDLVEFEISGGTSILQAPVENVATFLISGGTVQLDNFITGVGEFEITGGNVTFGNRASLSADDWVISGGVVTPDPALAYAGDFTLETGGLLTLAGGDLLLSGAANLDGGEIDGAKYRLLTSGAIAVDGLTLGDELLWLNSGVATQSDDGLTLGDSSGEKATLVNGAKGVYDLAGDSGIALGASASLIINAGTLERTDAGTSVVAPDIANRGEISIAGGVVDLTGLLTGAGRVDVLAAGTLEFGGPSSEFVFVRNKVDLGAGARLNVDGGHVALANAVKVSGAIMDGSGVLDTRGATSTSALTIGGTLTWINLGTVREAGGDVAVGDAAFLINAASGVYDIADNHGVAASAPSYIDNAGLFEKTGGSKTSVIAANMLNTGTIDAETGTLDLQGSLWGAGQVEVGAGATVELDGSGGAAVQLAFAAATGTIALDDFNAKGGSQFFGVISGFGADDAIDLGAPYGAGTHVLFAENAMGTGGVLTLVDGHIAGHVALAGSYATTDFAVKASAGGAVVTFV